jgi:hypothetical protein
MEAVRFSETSQKIVLFKNAELMTSHYSLIPVLWRSDGFGRWFRIDACLRGCVCTYAGEQVGYWGQFEQTCQVNLWHSWFFYLFCLFIKLSLIREETYTKGWRLGRTIFWDLTPHSLVENHRRFGETTLPMLAAILVYAPTLITEQYVPLKRRQTSARLDGVNIKDRTIDWGCLGTGCWGE